jgi:hypothetical protein
VIKFFSDLRQVGGFIRGIYQKKLKQLYIIISINCFISPGTQPSNPTWMVWFGFMVFNATLDNISVL